MNCTSCNMPHAGHELVDGKCLRCWAKAHEELRTTTAMAFSSIQEQHKAEVVALRGEIEEIRQRLAVFETEEWQELKSACLDWDCAENAAECSGAVITQAVQVQRFNACGKLHDAAIDFARAQKP